MKTAAQTTFAERRWPMLGRAWRGLRASDIASTGPARLTCARWDAGRPPRRRLLVARPLAALGVLAYAAFWLALLFLFWSLGLTARTADGDDEPGHRMAWRCGHVLVGSADVAIDIGVMAARRRTRGDRSSTAPGSLRPDPRPTCMIQRTWRPDQYLPLTTVSPPLATTFPARTPDPPKCGDPELGRMNIVAITKFSSMSPEGVVQPDQRIEVGVQPIRAETPAVERIEDRAVEPARELEPEVHEEQSANSTQLTATKAFNL